MADLGQGVHAALVRPRVPGLRRADHQRPVVRSDSRPESICIVMSIAGSEIAFFWEKTLVFSRTDKKKAKIVSIKYDFHVLNGK